MSRPRTRRRICLLDELRGFSIILMVFFHAFYLIGWEYHVDFCRTLFDFFSPAQPVFAGLFIFICGISCNLSHNNWKRGVLLAAAAALLSAVLWCAVWWRMLSAGSVIWFGILHLLAVSILLYTLLRPVLKYIPPLLGLLLCLILFILCYHIPHGQGGWFGIRGWFTLAIPAAATDHPLLYAFGLCPVSQCGDYFPLLPWFFCFLGGSFTGVWATRGQFPKWMYRNRFPWVATVGRHTLWIYLLHQPVLYVLCEPVYWLFQRLF